MKLGFDSEKYLEEQSKFILERVNNFDKLYLEFGGKLIFDMHAKRVLPGFDENAKIKLLQNLRTTSKLSSAFMQVISNATRSVVTSASRMITTF